MEIFKNMAEFFYPEEMEKLQAEKTEVTSREKEEKKALRIAAIGLSLVLAYLASPAVCDYIFVDVLGTTETQSFECTVVSRRTKAYSIERKTYTDYYMVFEDNENGSRATFKVGSEVWDAYADGETFEMKRIQHYRKDGVKADTDYVIGDAEVYFVEAVR